MLSKEKVSRAKNIKIGDTLKYLRVKNGLSIKNLSTTLASYNYPISIKTIYKWENNKILPDIKSLNTLSKVYNVNIEYFFDNNSKVHALNNMELKLISYLHSYKAFKKIVFLLAKLDKEQ